MQKFIASIFVFLISFSQGVTAFEFSEKQLQNAQKLIDAAIKDDVGYRTVESLTTEVGPRLAGTEAEKRARDWAIKHLKSLGFKNVRVEEFNVPLWEREIEFAEVVSPFPQALTITALGGSVSTPDSGVEGDIVSFKTLAALKRAKADSLKGKIVFVDEVMARTQDGSGYGAAVAKRGEAAFEAHRVGALAALIRSVGTSSHRFAHTGQMKRITDTEVGPSVPAAALSAPDADQLRRMLDREKNVKVKVVIKTQTMPVSKSGNVVAEIRGRERPDEIVLISAHLDSWDLGTGAVDDGAGVGIVTAAAHLIDTVLKKNPKRTIRVVLFGSEEVGLVGAKAYTDLYKDKLNKHIAIAESDFGADVVWRLASNNVAEEKRPIMSALHEVIQPLKIMPGGFLAYGGPDLKYMREAGVPVVEFSQNGRDYFDLHHTADDTFDKINPIKLRQNIAAYAAVIYLIADMDERFK